MSYTGIQSDNLPDKDTTGSDQGSKGPADDQNNQGTKRVNARVPWTREVNKLVMECYLRNEPSRRGYRKRMLNIRRNDIGVFECSEQRLADQVRAIKVNNWLDLEMEELRRKIDRCGASNEQMTDVTRENHADIRDHYSSLQPEFEDAQPSENENGTDESIRSKMHMNGLDEYINLAPEILE